MRTTERRRWRCFRRSSGWSPGWDKRPARRPPRRACAQLALVDVRLDVRRLVLGLLHALTRDLVPVRLHVGVAVFSSLVTTHLVKVFRSLMAITLVRSHRSSSL